MNVLIVGGGEIGLQIASALHGAHNITVLDVKEARESLLSLDVQFVQGTGSDPDAVSYTHLTLPTIYSV